MLKTAQYWILTAIGVTCLLGVAVNIVLAEGNSSRQSEVSKRAQYIQQTVQLQSLYQNMVRALANMAVRNKDPALRSLLAKQGINLTVKPAQSSAEAKQEGKGAKSASKAPRSREGTR